MITLTPPATASTFQVGRRRKEKDRKYTPTDPAYFYQENISLFGSHISADFCICVFTDILHRVRTIIN